MTELGDSHALHRRARAGVELMLTRRMLILAMAFASGVVLARILPPSDFGVFAIAFFVTSVARMIAELGLSQALIQQPGELEPRVVRTAFTLQQAVALALLVALWIGAGWLPRVYPDASAALPGLVRLLALQLVALPWTEISDTYLERSLRFDRVAPIEVAGAVGYNATALALVLAGAGVWSLAWGTLVAAGLRSVLAYRAAPWRPALGIDPATAGVLVRRGAAIQVGRFIGQTPHWVTPTLVAGTIGATATGLLQWAAGNGRKPLEALEATARVSLPHFSRLQDDVPEMERALARYVTGFALLCGLWLVVLAVAGEDLIAFVYGEHWIPAAPAMTLFAAAGLLASGGVIATTALVGAGRTAFAARVNLYGAATTAIASVGLVLAIGPLGVPLGQIVGAAIVLPWLASGVAPGAAHRVLADARRLAVPIGLALLAGSVVRVAAGDGGAAMRGVLTAGATAVAYAGAVWWRGPAWIRRMVLGPRAGGSGAG